jgi:CubicO group peptidase (beta-lactamase class C family)
MTLALFFFTAIANAATPLGDRIAHRVRDYVEAGLFSGVVVVSRGDTIVYEHAFGIADRTFGIANTISSKFHIASVSKPITAAAVLLLADRGTLALTDPVSKYVPDFPNGANISIEQVLTHYSGLGDTSNRPEYNEWSRVPQTTASLVERLAKLPPRDEPGKAFRYSNANYHLLAFIIEKVSGQSYGDFLRDNLFKPLGMTSSGHHGDEKEIIPGLATGYMPKGVAGFEKPSYFDWTSKTGNGSLYTSAHDLLAFHRALQRGTLLKPETVTASYGFGRADRDVGAFWFRGEKPGHRSVYMGGSSPGYKAYIERFIDDDVAVIVLSNLYLASPTPIGNDIAEILWNREPKLPPVPKRVSRPAEELSRHAGEYRFGSNFYTPNLLARVERRDDYLVMIYVEGSTVIPLLPMADGQYFDRLYWSFVRFEERKLIYRNGDSEFVALRQ